MSNAPEPQQPQEAPQPQEPQQPEVRPEPEKPTKARPAWIPVAVATVLGIFIIALQNIVNVYQKRVAQTDALVRGVQASAELSEPILLDSDKSRAPRLLADMVKAGSYRSASYVVGGQVIATTRAELKGTKVDIPNENDFKPRVEGINGGIKISAPVLLGENNVAGWLQVETSLDGQ